MRLFARWFVIFACSFVSLAWGQSISSKTPPPPLVKSDQPIPLAVAIPTAPTAFRGAGGWHLCYELFLTNLSSSTWTVELIQVTNQSGMTILGVNGNTLNTVMAHPGWPHGSKTGKPPEIAAGETVVAYMWVDLAKNTSLPTQLHHVLKVRKAGEDKSAVMQTPSTAVMDHLPEIQSPLHGRNWLAVNGPSNSSLHRRTIIVDDGTPHLAQRYAIDWVMLGENQQTYHDDPKENGNYYCFGQEAHAVANGVVVEVKDDIPENTPRAASLAVPINFDTVAGNHVNLDLSGGVYAMYAHLQPGSIKVKVGDKVTTGQVLGLVGNTGNSSEPHLHFQLMDHNSPLGSEGLPYA